MAGSRFRWFVVGLVSMGGAALLALTSVMNSAFVAGASPDTIGFVIGGSGTPIPGTDYVDAADSLYIHPNFPDTTYPGVLANGIFTPEGLYPLDGVKVLPFNYPSDASGFPAQSTSVGQGMTILENYINSLQTGDTATVFGYSQSSVIASLVMQQLDTTNMPSTLPVQFVLIGDQSAPNGGILERFAGFQTLSGDTHSLPLTLPSLGFNFDSITPADDFQTAIYSLEYDGFADFPRYPLNLLADLNAFLGIRSLHGTYLNQGFTPVHSGGPTSTDINNAILLPGSEHSTTDPCAACLTDYHMIDTIDGQQITPPLVSLLGGIPLIGKPLEDLLGPDLTALINFGYGDPDFGYSTDPANIATPFGLLPDFSDWAKLPGALWDGTIKGFTDFFDDLLHPAAAVDAVTGAAAAPAAAFSSLSDFINALSGAAAALYSAVLPTADIINALVSSIPAYDVSLIWDNLQHFDLLDAIGLPFAANTALFTLAAGFEAQIISNVISQAMSYFS